MDNYKQRIADHLDGVKTILADVEREGASALTEAENLIGRTAGLVEAAEAAEKALADTKLRVDKETKTVEADIANLKTENRRLVDDNNALLAQKSDLTVQNVRLDKANKDFVAYEERAWKLLDAKNEELVEREKKVSEKENMEPGVRSFLPPLP